MRMFGLGMMEVVVILVIGLFLFGHRLPDMARSLGKSLAAFKHEADNLRDDVRQSIK
jgi:sec-independent protein translocase protein TatA